MDLKEIELRENNKLLIKFLNASLECIDNLVNDLNRGDLCSKKLYQRIIKSNNKIRKEIKRIEKF